MFNKKNIMFLTDVLGQIGGAEQNLCQVARALRNRGYSVIISCLAGGTVAENLKNEGFDVHIFHLKKIYSSDGIRTLLELKRIIKTQRISVIICSHESSDFLGVALRLFTGIPVISNRRDMGFKLNRKHIWAYRLINRIFVRIVTVSFAVKQEIIKTQWVDERKIAVIRNGVDFSLNETDDNKKILNELIGTTISDECVVIGCLANIKPVKGQIYLVEAAKILKDEFTNFYVVFLGSCDDDKAYFDNITLKISEYGLQKRIFFTGPVRKALIPSVLMNLDISVLPSLTEGMSNVILESMHAGLPVVATDVGGNPECVEPNRTGFLVPPKNPTALANELKKLITSKSLRKKMGDSGACKVKKKFSEKVMIDHVETLLKGL